MATTTPFSGLTGEYTIDPNHSRFGFVARHAMVTKVRGAFTEFAGSATIDGENVAGSSATVTIQAASVDTRVKQRNDHLRSGDFFDVEKFPAITFKSTAVKQVSDSEFEVTGDLTIRDVTRSLTITLEYNGAATDPTGNHRIGFEGTTSIQRSDYGLTYNAAMEAGGILVSDKITLEIEISAIKN